MSRVTTWINNAMGTLSNRVGIRISHDLTLSEMITGLGSQYGRNVPSGEEPELPQLSRKEMVEAIKAEYAYYGTNAVWTWTESADAYQKYAVELWAEDLILKHYPEMDKHRA